MMLKQEKIEHKSIVKQTSCPSLKVMPWSSNTRNISPPATPPPAESHITPKEAMPSVTGKEIVDEKSDMFNKHVSLCQINYRVEHLQP